MAYRSARYMDVVVEPSGANGRAVERTAVRYVMVGWKLIEPTRVDGERYLAIVVRIDNDTDAPQRIVFRYFRLRASTDRPEPSGIEPEHVRRVCRKRCVIDPGTFARVTLAFAFPAPDEHGTTTRTPTYRLESEFGVERDPGRHIGPDDRRVRIARHLSSVSHARAL